MKRNLIILLISFAALWLYGSTAFTAAQEDIIYPISELSNCTSREECEAYCDQKENMQTCLNFAEEHNLLAREEIRQAREMLELGETAGPGGCKGQAECEVYCDNINHLEECLAFAESHNLIPASELAEARKVAQAMKRGIRPPGGCTSKAQCDIYCSNPANMEACIAFGEAAGLIPPGELEEAKMMLRAIKKGAKPLPCQSKTACDIYCEQPENFEVCINFAEAAGFVSAEEAKMARLTGGKGPGGCRGKECDTYCGDAAHMKDCMEFALQYGLMSPEEADRTRRMLEAGFTAGPGGCTSETECDAYCQTHQEECIDYAVKIGNMTQEEAEQIRQDRERGMRGGPGGCKSQEECEAFCNNPANMRQCVEFGVEIGEMSREEADRIFENAEQGSQLPDSSDEAVDEGRD